MHAEFYIFKGMAGEEEQLKMLFFCAKQKTP
jgi:hypothetical protein